MVGDFFNRNQIWNACRLLELCIYFFSRDNKLLKDIFYFNGFYIIKKVYMLRKVVDYRLKFLSLLLVTSKSFK